MDQRPRFDAKYHIGIEQVDTEHRQLFEIAGRARLERPPLRPPPGGFLLIRPDQ